MNDKQKLIQTVDVFALAMKNKLMKKCDEDYSGWDNENVLTLDDIISYIEWVAACADQEPDDFVDIANYAMFAFANLKKNASDYKQCLGKINISDS